MEPEGTVKNPPENQTSTPVMDVVAPPPPAPVPSASPTDEVDPVDAAFAEPAPPAESTDEPAKTETAKPAATTVNKPGNSPTAAITLSVIVMIVLAGLATFAYIQQNK